MRRKARIISRLTFYTSVLLLLAQVTQGQSDEASRVVSIEYRLNGEILNDSNLLRQLQQKTAIVSGEPLSAYRIGKSVEAIYSIGRFSQIHVLKRRVAHITPTPETVDGVALTFLLTRKTLIRQIEYSSTHLDKDRIHEALRAREGGEYDEQVAREDQQRISNLYEEMGYFQAKVRFTPPTDFSPGSEIDLFYEITEGKQALIRAIEPKEIKGELTLKAGDAYEKSVVENARSHLRKVYREQGYLNVRVQYVRTYHHASNEVSLQFTVTKGKKVNVIFKPDNVNKKELRKVMSLFKQDSYSPEILQRNEQQLERFYRQKGYYNPQVTHQIKPETDGEVNIEFQMDLGIAPRIARIDFEGNREFDDATLLDLMKTKPRSRWSAPGLGWLFSSGIFDPRIFNMDLRVLKLSYRQAGYPHAQIDKEQKVRDNQLYLHIKIREGKLLFDTNLISMRDLDNDTILEELRRAFEEHGLRLSENINVAIQKADSSWLLTDVDNRETYSVWKEEKKLNIYESKKLVINNVLILGNQTLKREALLSEFNARKGEPYSKDMVVRDQFRLRFLYNREGYIYANIEPEYDSTSGVLTYHIIEGNKATFGEFNFYGTLGVKVGVLEREFKHLKGKQFDPEKLEAAKFRLYTLGLFRSIETKTPDKFNEKTVINVNVHVDVRKARSVSVSGGYSPSEGIRGTVGMTHYNILKRNIRVGGRVQLGTKGNLGEVTWIEPWIKPPLIGQMMGTFRLFRDNLVEHDDTHAIGGTANLAKRLGLRSNFAVQYKYQELRQKLEDSDNLTTVSSIGASFHQDHRDSFLDPHNGRLNEFAVEYAGGFMRGQESFSKFTSDNRYYRELPKIGGFVHNIVYAGALRLGYAKGLRSNRERSIASFERFWAGGSTTVRGYEERTLGPENEMTPRSADGSSNERRGDVLLILNAELRIPIYRRVGAVLFIDTGNVWNNLSELNKNAPFLHSAVGIGIRIATPLGPARIDYGIPLVKGRSHEPYFGLGHAF